jgi:hypothetical protein
VALKKIKSGDIQELKAEIQLLSKLSHPCIVQYSDRHFHLLPFLTAFLSFQIYGNLHRQRKPKMDSNGVHGGRFTPHKLSLSVSFLKFFSLLLSRKFAWFLATREGAQEH